MLQREPASASDGAWEGRRVRSRPAEDVVAMSFSDKDFAPPESDLDGIMPIHSTGQ